MYEQCDLFLVYVQRSRNPFSLLSGLRHPGLQDLASGP